MTTINTIDDFLKILDDHPAWREAVRARILAQELLQLSPQVNALTARANALTERLDAFAEYVAAFIQRQESFDAGRRRFHAHADVWMNRINPDSGILKGMSARAWLRDRRHVIIEELEYDLTAILPNVELVRMSRQIPDATPGQRRSFGRSDLVALASDRASGETLYITAEASWTAELRHTNRAQRHARFLTQITGLPAVPVIVSIYNTGEVETLIESGAVKWIQLDERDLARN